MIRSKLSIPIIVLTVLFSAGLLFVAVGHASRSAMQDAERSLDIERYPNEPLEVVDIKVSEQSVKSKIKVSSRRNGEGLDNIKFKDKDEWFKRVAVKLRNVSGKRIVGLAAYLYFEPPNTRTLFSLTLSGSTQLKRGVLEPGDEIEFTVKDQSWNRTAENLKKYGVEANLPSVTLSVEHVMFDDDTQWHRGLILRRAPDNPDRWLPVNKAAPGASQLSHPVQFPTSSGRARPQTNA